MFGNTKSPEVLVTAGDDWVPLDWLISVTVVVGTSAACASFTVPDTVPVTPCARAGIDAASNRPAATSAARELLPIPPCDMTAPPLHCQERWPDAFPASARSGL